jgi:hypothetical protein
MGKNQSSSNLTNIIKQDASGNISFVSGSTTLMSVSSSGTIETTGNVAGTASYASNAELFDGLDSTVFTLTSSFAAQTASFTAFTSSVNTFTASLNSFSASILTFTASQNILNGTYATTGSNTFRGSQYISSSFTPTDFTDTASLYTDGGLRVTRNAYLSSSLYVNGDLIIFGSQSVNYISSSQLDIADNIITVNTSTPTLRFGGLAVRDSGSLGTGLTGSLLWDSQDNQWIYSNPSGSEFDSAVFLVGPRNYGTIGNEVGITTNALVKGDSFHHMTSSGIFESGSNMGIGTSSPGYKLDVQGTGRFTDALTTSNISTSLTNGTVLIRDNGTAQVEVNIRHTSTRNGVLSFTENGVADRWAIGTKPSDGTLYFSANFDLSTPKLTLSSAGIATFSGAYGANAGVVVSGTTYGVFGAIRGTSAYSAGMNYISAGVQKWFTGIYENTDNFGFYNATNATFPMVITTGGNVQIGSSANSAGYGLEVYGGNQRVVVQDNANGTAGVFFRVLSGGSQVGNVTLRTDNTGTFSVFTGTSGEGERMRITSGGDVSMTGTGAMKIQSGTTAQRPTAAAGQIRYNTSLGEVEVNNGSNWGSLQTKVMLGSSPSNAAESANDIKTYYPNATNGFYWIKQTGNTAVSAYCVFKDFTGADIQGGPWTVPIISNDANGNFSTNGTTAAATFLSKCQAIGINTPGRGMEGSRTATEVYGAWLAVKRTIWEAYTPFVSNGNTNAGAVLRMPIININGEGGSSDFRCVYNTGLGTILPPNESGDACNANQLFCGWWAATDTSSWRTNNNNVPGPEDWGPSDNANTAYNGAGVNSVLTVCVYK